MRRNSATTAKNRTCFLDSSIDWAFLAPSPSSSPSFIHVPGRVTTYLCKGSLATGAIFIVSIDLHLPPVGVHLRFRLIYWNETQFNCSFFTRFFCLFNVKREFSSSFSCSKISFILCRRLPPKQNFFHRLHDDDDENEAGQDGKPGNRGPAIRVTPCLQRNRKWKKSSRRWNLPFFCNGKLPPLIIK